jgi:hypothetical protein
MQNRFNVMKRHHPDRLDDLADQFKEKFGCWPKGTPPPKFGTMEARRASGLPIRRRFKLLGKLPRKPESPPVFEHGAGLRPELNPTKDIVPLKKGQRKTGFLFQSKPETESARVARMDREVRAAEAEAKTHAEGSPYRRYFERLASNIRCDINRVPRRFPNLRLPSAEPILKPDAEPEPIRPKAPASGLSMAKALLDDAPEMLSAAQVALLRKDGVSLPKDVAARFPISGPARPATTTKKAAPARRDRRNTVPA